MQTGGAFGFLGGESGTVNARITALENVANKITYFQAVSSASGTLTLPTGATVLLDEFYSGEDAYVSTIVNGQPTGQLPSTSSGAIITLSSFDASGNYTLSGTPSAYPVAIIYKLSIAEKNMQYLTQANILDLEGSGVLSIGSVVSSATPTPSVYSALNQYEVTALGVGATFGAPTGMVADGIKLVIRVKDDGTTRTLAFNPVYRFAPDLPYPPSTTPNMTLYFGFIYNEADSVWDCVAIKDNL